MRFTSSLRFRVAAAFAYLGAFFSLLLAVSLYFAIENIGHELMDQSLRAELSQALTRVAHGEQFDIPNSVTIRGYMRGGEGAEHQVPAEVVDMAPGHHNVTIGGVNYRVLVTEDKGERYFLLFNSELQHNRESELLKLLLIVASVLTVLAAAGGFWLAMHIVTPVTRLAGQVGQAHPEEVSVSPPKLLRDDEVGELARAFDRYSRRVHSFVKREKQFTGDISHELRTPLAVILAALEVLGRDPRVMEIQGPRIERMKRAVLETNELCTALLMLAREREPESNESGYAVAEVVRNCIERHRHFINPDMVRLEVELVGNPRLAVERTLLEIVISNLLRNAFSYTQSGKVCVRLEEDRFIVSDTGIGIHDADADRIFQLHYRGEASTGEGVGLSLVKRICDRFDWTIFATGQEGLGTTVEVRFSNTPQLPSS